jgi:hypothetical protein
MAKPNRIKMTDIPDAELQDFLDEVAEEDKFDVESKTKDNGTWTVVLVRKVPV